MSWDLIKLENAICNYAYGGYYAIDYNRYGTTLTAQGFLWHYHSGNVVLLSEDGIYHMRYRDILFMAPVKNPPLDRFNERYRKLLEELQENNC